MLSLSIARKGDEPANKDIDISTERNDISVEFAPCLLRFRAWSVSACTKPYTAGSNARMNGSIQRPSEMYRRVQVLATSVNDTQFYK